MNRDYGARRTASAANFVTARRVSMRLFSADIPVEQVFDQPLREVDHQDHQQNPEE